MSTHTTDEINAANALLGLSNSDNTINNLTQQMQRLSLSDSNYTTDEMNAAYALISLSKSTPPTTTPNPTPATQPANSPNNSTA